MKPRQPSTTQAQAVVEGKVPSPSDSVRQMWQRGAREGLRHSSGGGFFIGERKPCRFKRSSARNVRQTYPLDARYVCEQCFGPARGRVRPLGARPRLDQAGGSRPARSRSGATRTSCRSSRRPQPGLPVGLTPLQRAPRLAERLGLGEVWVKNDTANPTHSFKDRVVAVALAKAQELGYEVVACASTGNLAERGGGPCRRGGARVLRVHPVGPRGAEGARHRGLRHAPGGRARHLRRRQPALHRALRGARLGVRERERAAVLRRGVEDARRSRSPSSSASSCPTGWSRRWPRDRCSRRSPAGSRSGSRSGLVEGSLPAFNGAQADGLLARGHGVRGRARTSAGPVKPRTIAKSLAIGNPADGPYALDLARRSGGSVESVTRRRDPRGHPAAGRDHRHLHRDRGRRDHRRAPEAGRAGGHRGGRAGGRR